MANIYQEQARVFKAFCDEKRLQILQLLQGGEKCACVLLERFDIGQSTLSYHMKILCESGVVASRQEGKWTHYQISPSGREGAIKLLQDITAPKLDNISAPDKCKC